MKSRNFKVSDRVYWCHSNGGSDEHNRKELSGTIIKIIKNNNIKELLINFDNFASLNPFTYTEFFEGERLIKFLGIKNVNSNIIVGR
ncbi:hypothetical protein LCGC14_2283860 [marine sediment metagenome]|uniref:Uncharacterized protein n=1 Tax=marine sediment metagenome TaxID=412755 RepID=A0A0F9CT36_9ZZZZ